ncbi:SDR family NAD(P)-dependent oxidoreductase [Natrinema pallidum]|uniref:SDR family NAD(P)-dependent oxidoreductase n=1 Tax=Natrinema pallidum TaxID=69527 RepID=UPI000A55606A
MSELFDLDGRVAVVTGGGRGIGRAIAVELANAGAAVVPSARSSDEIEAVAAAIEDDGGDAIAVPADVTDGDAVSDVIDSATDEFGGIDIVVNNAGLYVFTPRNRRRTVGSKSGNSIRNP